MKRKQIGALFLSIAIVLVIVVSFSARSDSEVGGEIKTSYIHASSVLDVNSKEEKVGHADYVFVAKVISEDRVLYKYPAMIENEKGELEEVKTPYSLYTVEIIDNIKGKLKKNTPIEIQKAGGIDEDGTTIYIYHGDELLKEESYYILLGYAQRDGSILVTGPNSSMVIDANSKEEIVSNKLYKEYSKALKNEVKSDRVRFKAKAEE